MPCLIPLPFMTVIPLPSPSITPPHPFGTHQSWSINYHRKSQATTTMQPDAQMGGPWISNYHSLWPSVLFFSAAQTFQLPAVQSMQPSLLCHHGGWKHRTGVKQGSSLGQAERTSDWQKWALICLYCGMAWCAYCCQTRTVRRSSALYKIFTCPPFIPWHTLKNKYFFFNI